MSFNVVSIDCIVVQVVYVEQWLKWAEDADS
jgi:hypothetical protein